MLKLDYTLQTPEERNELVKQILKDNPNPPAAYLEILADYLCLCMEKQERKQRKLITENRMATIGKRETSYEGLVSQLENGEDGIYNLINDNKNSIFQPKVTITKKDLAEIPELVQLREAINYWEEKLPTAQSKDKYIIKKTIIDLRKDQYVIKNAYRKPIMVTKLTRSRHLAKMDDSFTFDEDGYVIPSGISLMDPKIISTILCNYSGLKEAAWGEFEKDVWYLMYDFDKLADKALKPYPMYDRICEYKVDGLRNIQIQERLKEEFGVNHSVEYISNLWRNKIPKIIASVAEDEFLNYYYLNEEKGKYKRCGRCGQVKLAHGKYFSKNPGAPDGLYSICKSCRNMRSGQKQKSVLSTDAYPAKEE